MSASVNAYRLRYIASFGAYAPPNSKLYLRAVGELAVSQILWRDFRQRRIFSRLPLTSELDALFAENANSRPPVPEQISRRFLTTFVDFLVLFSPKTMLSGAPRRTVST